MSTSSTSNAIFTGSSAYSSDFQNLITRAVNIASLPLNLLNSQKTTLSGQSTEVGTLSSDFSNLQSAVNGIDQALSNSYYASTSDSSVLTATISAGAVESNYTVQLKDMGAYSTMMTGTWNAAAGSAQTYQLWIGDSEHDITPADNSAASVASAINASYSGQVHATVVNVGSTATPDYRISLQSANLTSSLLDLKDSNGNSFQSVQTAGRPAEYQIDNSGSDVYSDSRIINIATGVTLNILGQSDTAVTVNVNSSTSGLSSALASFVTSYNAVVSELGKQRGQGGGALQGESLVSELSSTLSGIVTGATAAGGLSGLHDLGLDLGSDGTLTFNSAEFSSTAASNPQGLLAFLGSVSNGGFLKSANDALTGITDGTTGILATTQTDLQSQITDLTNNINDKQDQIDNLQTQITNQMNAADASIATMEQQYTYISNVFQAMQTAAQQYK
jgi:flagellar hook-associated protein 2